MDLKTGERFYFMDAARSVLMTLGIFLHATFFYRSETNWRLVDPSGGPAFDVIFEVIHFFRMPAFFIIAGFFCMLTLFRYGPDQFYRRRMVRTAVPVLVIGSIFLVLQAFFTGTRAAGAMTDSYWLSDGEWAAHLWFLVYLVIYFSIAFLLGRSTAIHGLFKRVMALVDALMRLPQSQILLLLLYLPLASLALVVLQSVVPALQSRLFGLLHLYSLLDFGLFFMFGAILYCRKDVLERFAAPSLWILLIFGGLVAIYLTVPPSDGAAQKFLHIYSRITAVWICCALVFFVFKTFFNKRSERFIQLADASYTIYLLHYPLVLALGALLLDYDLPASVKYTLIIGVIFSLTWAAHHFLVLRFRPLRFLVNGVTSPTPKPVTPAVAEAAKSG